MRFFFTINSASQGTQIGLFESLLSLTLYAYNENPEHMQLQECHLLLPGYILFISQVTLVAMIIFQRLRKEIFKIIYIHKCFLIIWIISYNCSNFRKFLVFEVLNFSNDKILRFLSRYEARPSICEVILYIQK